MRFRSCLLVVLGSALLVQSKILPDSSNSGLVLLKLNTSNAVAFTYEDADQGGSNSTYREDSVPEHGTDIKTNGNAGISEFYFGSEGGQEKLLWECDFNSDSCLSDMGLAMEWIKTTSANGTKSKYQPPYAVSGKDGYFMMVDVTNKSDSDAAMSSRFISQEGHRRFCFKYLYSMQGENVHMLGVYVFFRSNQNAGTFLLSETGDQGPFWHKKLVSFETTKDSDFLFIFVARQEEIGDGAISVDKLQLIAGSCNGPEWQNWQSWGECSVTCGNGERSRTRICDGLNCKGSGSAKELCFGGECPEEARVIWQCNFQGQCFDFGRSVGTLHEPYNWRRSNSTTPTANTGPTRDHTTGTGEYIYTEASRGWQRDKASIVTNTMERSKSDYYCLTLWYHMYGDDIGSLEVFYVTLSQQGRSLLKLTGSQGNEWKEENIPIRTDIGDTFRLMITATRGRGDRGDISLDDLVVKEGKCQATFHKEGNFTVSGWSKWSKCGVSCGNGTQSRTRECRPRPCSISRFETKSCNAGSCSEKADRTVSNSKCGNPGMFGIIGGRAAKVGAWPWHVGLYRMTAFGIAYSCGATILSETYVITAAHCLYEQVNRTHARRISARRLHIRAGSNQITRGIRRQVEEVLIYHRYRFLSAKYDIALLRLDRNLTYNEFISPVCLPPRAPKTGESCFAVGWGRNSLNSKTVPFDLQELKMEILDSRSCFRAWGRVFGTARLCAGMTPKEETVYKGDSGGSFTCVDNGIFHLQGVTSLGNPARNIPAVFTDVWYYKRWIENYVK